MDMMAVVCEQIGVPNLTALRGGREQIRESASGARVPAALAYSWAFAGAVAAADGTGAAAVRASAGAGAGTAAAVGLIRGR